MAKVFIGIGSNSGNRRKNVIRALVFIEKKIIVKKISRFIETTPQEGVKGGKFLNGVIEGETVLSPQELLLLLRKTEQKIGRNFPHPTNKARKIDLDILFYDNLIFNEGTLKIPHPKFSKRYFVLKPFSEIAPDFKDPVSGKKIISLLTKSNPRV